MLPARELPRDLRVKLQVDHAFLARTMKALANPARLRLLGFLTLPHYLEEIASEMKVSRTAAARHIKVLEASGLVARVPGRREHGPVVDFVVVPERLFRLFDETRRLGVSTPRYGAAPEEVWRTIPLEAERRGRGQGQGARLLEAYGLAAGSVHRLDPAKRGEGWLLGRGEDADVRLVADPYVSKHHARMDYDASFTLADLGSTNGTLLNGEPLEAGKASPLHQGDLVTLGRTLLVFRTPV